MLGLALVVGALGWFLLGRDAPTPDPGPEEAADSRPPVVDAATLAARGPAEARAPVAIEGRIRAVVLGPDGAPVAGVRVVARHTGPAFDPEDPKAWYGGMDADQRARRTIAALDAPPAPSSPDAAGTTDASGQCDLPVGRPGQYDVAAEPPAPTWGSMTSVAVLPSRSRVTATLRIGQGSRLRGRVVDAQDRPLAVALRGRWTTPGAEGGAWIPPITRTEPETGAFAWEAVPAGKGWVTVTLPGRLTTTVAVTTPREDVVVIRIPDGGVLRGRVADRAGAPVADADLLVEVVGASTADASPRGGTMRARTGADGTYRMEGVLPGRVGAITVAAAGFRARTLPARGAPWEGTEVVEGKETVLDVVFLRGSVVEGRVLTEGTGAPVPGASVQALVPSSRWNDRPEPVTTDARGAFRLEGLAPGRYVLVATSATHYLPAFLAKAAEGVPVLDGEAQLGDAVVAVVTDDGERLERDLRLRAGLPVRGKVVGPDGSPVEGVKITCPALEPWNASWRWGVGQSGFPDSGTRTAADGTFRITGIPPGPAITLVAAKAPYASATTAPFPLAPGEPEPEVLVRLEMGASVAGLVLDGDGRPAAGVQVMWWSREGRRGSSSDTRTESDGSFRLEGLPSGLVTLQAWLPSGGGGNADVTPPLGPGEARTGVEIRLRRPARITGLVVDAQGQPVAGAPLVAAPAEPGLNYGTATSRDDGTFEFSAVGEGTYRVGVNPSGQEGVLSVPTEAQQVKAPVDGVRITAKPRVKTLVTGRVVLPDGSPVPLCRVRPETSADPRIRGMGDASGEVVGGAFRLEVDAAPPFGLRVSGVAGADGRRLNVREKRVTVEKETKDLRITLEPGLSVAGRVTDDQGAGLSGVRVTTGTQTVVTDAAGAFRFDGLGEGDVWISAAPTPGWAAPPARTVPAGTVDLVLPCSRGVAISGRVLGPKGEAMTQGSVSATWSDNGHAWAQIGEGGAFTIEGIPVDAVVDLEVTTWDRATSQPLRPLRRGGVRAGTTGLELRLDPGVTVEGVVLDADGRALAGTYVSARIEGGNSHYSTPTDAQGRFTIGGLAPGPVRLHAVEEKNGFREIGVAVQVEAPATGVRLVVPRKVRIQGRLSGDALAGFVVFARPAEAEEASGYTASAEVAADGRFALEVWEGVPYAVGATSRTDDRYVLQSPVRGGADLTLALEVGLSIEGTLERPDGRPAKDVWVFARSAVWSAGGAVGADGAWRIRGLPKGTYRLRTSLDDGAAETTVEAGARGVRLPASR